MATPLRWGGVCVSRLSNRTSSFVLPLPFWSLVLLSSIVPQLAAAAAAWTRISLTTPRRYDTTTLLRDASIGEACGITYEEPVFRPPAESRSLILQVTVGCSWNRCAFCEMYQDKTYRARPLRELEDELGGVVRAGGANRVRDVFLADGDAMTLPTSHLLGVCRTIRDRLPRVRRISSYCLPRNVRHKSVEELTALREQGGLGLVYVGCESGDDDVLRGVEKGETYGTSLDALERLREAGVKRSVMILLGLGGRNHSFAHAVASAKLCSAARPEFLSVLTTTFPRGMERMLRGFERAGLSFEPLATPREGLEELEVFLTALDLPSDGGRTVFRSDHASNYLVLKGRLGRDRDRLLSELRSVLDSPPEEDVYNLRPEWMRGL